MSTPVELTIMGTTDLHGSVFNWNYYKNAEYDDSAKNDIGLAKVATLVEAVRSKRVRDHTLMIDAGDTIQGTPLAYYFARIAPIAEGNVHPMAAAMNHIGYDAAALGNHEFNYGIEMLRTFADQLDLPLLGANALDVASGRTVFPPYVIKTVKVRGEKPIKVGILGLANPGIAIWDRANVEGKMTFPSPCGARGSGHRRDPGRPRAPRDPRAAGRQRRHRARGRADRAAALGVRLSVIDLLLVRVRGRWVVQSVGSSVLNSNTVAEDPRVLELLTADHDKVVTYINSVIGSCTEAMSCRTARYEGTAALDFINLVQAQAVRTAIAGTRRRRCRSSRSPRRSTAKRRSRPVRSACAMSQGSTSSTTPLLGITFTGSQVKAYLEKSVEYFKKVTGTSPFTPDELTNAVTPVAPTGTPDYNYDVMGGLDAPLTYDIDVAQDPGSRVVNLAYDGAPIDPVAQFVVAINNCRQSGGGGFPGVTTAPVVHNAQEEIRQLIIDWVTSHKDIDPSVFAHSDWRLVSSGQPVQIIG